MFSIKKIFLFIINLFKKIMRIDFANTNSGSGGGLTPQQATNIVRNTATGVVVDSLTDITNPQKGQVAIIPEDKELEKPTQYYIFDGSEWQTYGDNGAFNYDIEEERVQARALLNMNLPVSAYIGTTGVGGKVQMNVSTSGYFDNYSYINAWNGTPRMRDMRNGEISLNAQNMAILKIYITDSTGEATIVGRNFDEGYIRDAFGKTYSNEPNMGKSLEVSLANTKFYAEVWYMNDEGSPINTNPYYMPLLWGVYGEDNNSYELWFEDTYTVIDITFNNSFDDSSFSIGNWQKEWIGTQAEYDALTVTHPSTEYYITEG